MQLVVEGTTQFRRIISVGLDGHVYTLGPDQAIRAIADWGGRQKSACHWDETNQIIIDEPYPEKPQDIENALREAAAGAGVELNLRDEDGDVRWRIVPNEDGKVQIEVDPIDKPHVGEWLLNGVLGLPRIEDGQLLICRDGELQGITLSELKKLIEDEN